MRFAGKTVVLCVTGGIAAYKAADLTSKLHQNGAEVRVLMTESATQFISPMTFETLSCNRTVVDTFDRNFPWEVEHISLAKAADVFVIAPATANIIAKAAHGIADDMVSTTLLATKAPVVIAPAMNTGMYDNPVTQENLKTLRARGFHIIEPAAGHLACGDSGRGHSHLCARAGGEILRVRARTYACHHGTLRGRQRGLYLRRRRTGLCGPAGRPGAHHALGAAHAAHPP